MSTPSTEQPPTSPKPPEAGQQAPWERDGQPFDPQRAWQLIQTLKGERDGLKGEREALAGKVSEFEQKTLTETQRLEQRAAQAEESAKQAQQEALRYRVASAMGVPADLLAGDTEEAITAHAQRLQEFRTATAAAPAPSTPRPDPSQGSRGAGTSLGREAGLEQARKRGFLPAQTQ